MNSAPRPANYTDSDPFKSQDDMFDYTDLIQLDPAWSALYNSECDSIEQLEEETKKQASLALIASEDFDDHLTGYVFYREIHAPEWVVMSSIYTKFSGYGYASAPPEVKSALLDRVRFLHNEGKIEVSLGGTILRTGPKLGKDVFPVLDEGFDEWANDFLASRGGRSRMKYIVLEHFAEDITPFEFWAGAKRIAQLTNDGRLGYGEGQIYIPQQEEAWMGGLFSKIESNLTTRQEAAGRIEGELRTLGNTAIGKPKQRGRGWGEGRRR